MKLTYWWHLLSLLIFSYDCVANDKMGKVLSMAHVLLNGSFNAGSGYPDVWVRDLNTFIEAGMGVNMGSTNLSWRDLLIGFLERQLATGEIPDGYTPGATAPSKWPTCLRMTAFGPFCKNTVETDQESSLVQAVEKYVHRTSNVDFLREKIKGTGRTVFEGLEGAMTFLMRERFDNNTGLIWGGTTVDWGDVQVESNAKMAQLLDSNSHKSIDIYDNAMFVMALNAMARLSELLKVETTKINIVRSWALSVANNARKYLWNASAGKFIPHLYLQASPFPLDFDESSISIHGGTACAALAGVLTKVEILDAYTRMQEDVRSVAVHGGNVTIGLTVYPPYPHSTGTNPNVLQPYVYQNGGDWSWFGGRMVQALAQYGFIAEAREALEPMLDRVIAHDGFFEWWAFDGSPRGSANFKGSAGVLAKAIQTLQSATSTSLPRPDYTAWPRSAAPVFIGGAVLI